MQRTSPFFLLVVAAAPLLSKDVGWRSYAVYQPRIERAIKARYPEVRNCFIEVQAAADHEALALEDAIG